MPLQKCQQRIALFEEYRASTNAYIDLIKQLRGALAADYEFVHKRAEAARKKMAAARENFDLHLAMHHCL
jgi:hypothetical protein